MSNPPLQPTGKKGGQNWWRAREKDSPAQFCDRALLVQRTLRSGQVISYPGSVVVMGDVNPGAEVKAGGSIIVLGSLRGTAHAGAWGDEKAVVIAFRLDPTQVRIAQLISRSPDTGGIDPQEPEIARIQENLVVIEPYMSYSERKASS